MWKGITSWIILGTKKHNLKLLGHHILFYSQKPRTQTWWLVEPQGDHISTNRKTLDGTWLIVQHPQFVYIL